MMPQRRAASLSVSAFAKRLGVDEKAVRKAIQNGRLERGVGRDARGAPVITDVDVAGLEFRQNRDASKVRDNSVATTADARRALIREQTRKLKIANDLKAREMIPRQEAEHLWSTQAVAVRTKLLGVPSAFRQRCPHITKGDMDTLDALIREALEALAGGEAENAE